MLVFHLQKKFSEVVIGQVSQPFYDEKLESHREKKGNRKKEKAIRERIPRICFKQALEMLVLGEVESISNTLRAPSTQNIIIIL